MRGESSFGPSRSAIPTLPPNLLSHEASGADHHFTLLGNIVCPGMLLRSSAQTQGDGSTPLWAPHLDYRRDAVTEADCILLVGDARSAAVASALSQTARLPLDIGEWKKSSDNELINNLRRGLLMVNTFLQLCKSLHLFVFANTLDIL